MILIYKILIAAVVGLHIIYLLGAVFGSLLVLKWRKIIWLHIATLGWGLALSYFHLICPLNLLDNWLRTKAGLATYGKRDFLQHYLPTINQFVNNHHPDFFNLAVVVFSLIIYWLAFRSPKTK